MKKLDAIKDLPKYLRDEISKLDRRCPYIINWRGHELLIQITHFYKTGIHYKPLSAPHGYKFPRRQGTIEYLAVPRHNFRKAKLEDLPLFMGEGTRFYTEYFSNTNVFSKNHSTELKEHTDVKQ